MVEPLYKYIALPEDAELTSVVIKKRPGAFIRKGDIVATFINKSTQSTQKLVSPHAGVFKAFTPVDAENLNPSQFITLQPCTHEKRLAGLCTTCGEKIESKPEDEQAKTDFQMMQAGMTFVFNHERAQKEESILLERLFSARKLLLILDLDNTLIHAMEIRSQSEMDDLKHELEAGNIHLLDSEPYYVKLRPFLLEFLQELSKLYEIWIYTKGTKPYALSVCRLIDPHYDIIKIDRIISRDDTGTLATKDIKHVLPFDNSIALILDDLHQEVWGECKNLVYTKPFYYFERKGQRPKMGEPAVTSLKIRRRSDAYLYFMKHLLRRVHSIFYELKDQGKKVTTYKVYRSIRGSLLTDVRAVFTGLFKSNVDLANTTEGRTLEKLGGTIQKELDNNTTLLMAKNYKVTSKTKEAKKLKVPIISRDYLFYCEIFCYKLNYETFSLLGSAREMLEKIGESLEKDVEFKAKMEKAENDLEREKLKNEQVERIESLQKIKDQIEELIIRDNQEEQKEDWEKIHDAAIRLIELSLNKKTLARDRSDKKKEKRIKTGTNTYLIEEEIEQELLEGDVSMDKNNGETLPEEVKEEAAKLIESLGVNLHHPEGANGKANEDNAAVENTSNEIGNEQPKEGNEHPTEGNEQPKEGNEQSMEGN